MKSIYHYQHYKNIVNLFFLENSKIFSTKLRKSLISKKSLDGKVNLFDFLEMYLILIESFFYTSK